MNTPSPFSHTPWPLFVEPSFDFRSEQLTPLLAWCSGISSDDSIGTSGLNVRTPTLQLPKSWRDPRKRNKNASWSLSSRRGGRNPDRERDSPRPSISFTPEGFLLPVLGSTSTPACPPALRAEQISEKFLHSFLSDAIHVCFAWRQMIASWLQVQVASHSFAEQQAWCFLTDSSSQTFNPGRLSLSKRKTGTWRAGQLSHCARCAKQKQPHSSHDHNLTRAGSAGKESGWASLKHHGSPPEQGFHQTRESRTFVNRYTHTRNTQTQRHSHTIHTHHLHHLHHLHHPATQRKGNVELIATRKSWSTFADCVPLWVGLSLQNMVFRSCSRATVRTLGGFDDDKRWRSLRRVQTTTPKPMKGVRLRQRMWVM